MGSQKSQTWLSDFPFLAYNQLNLVKRIPSRNETSWFLELLHFSVSINGDHLEVIFSFYFYFLNPHQSAFCHYHSPMRQLSSITSCWGLVTKLCAVLLLTHGLEPAWLLCPWDFPGKSIGVGCHFLLQGIFPTHRSNPGLLHYRQTLYHLSHQGSPCRLCL